jgi:hypothetical protein
VQQPNNSDSDGKAMRRLQTGEPLLCVAWTILAGRGWPTWKPIHVVDSSLPEPPLSRHKKSSARLAIELVGCE